MKWFVVVRAEMGLSWPLLLGDHLVLITVLMQRRELVNIVVLAFDNHSLF